MSTVTDEKVDLTTLAAKDHKVARTLAGAQAQALAAQQRAAEEDAAVERRLRTKQGRMELTQQREDARENRRERREQQREERREKKRQKKAETRAQLRKQLAAAIAYTRSNAAAVYSAVIYGLAVGGAVYGQVTAATSHDMPLPVGVIAAVAIEGIGLSMAATALEQRLAGERALLPRFLVFAATATAFGINLWGHPGWKGYLLATLSLLGITVWEVRSSAKHRKTLRAMNQLPEPPVKFGWRRWWAAPGPTWRAWRLDARQRVTPAAAELIVRAAAVDAEHEARQAQERAERERARVREQVAKAARVSARKAARKGDTGAALAVLMRLAQDGMPPQQPALPAAVPLDPEVQELCDLVRRQVSGARTRLFGSRPDPLELRRRPYVPAHPPRPVTPPPPARPEPPVRPEPLEEPEQPGPQRPARPEPGSRTASARKSSRTTAAAVARRVTVSAPASDADQKKDLELEKAYLELSTELGREPTGVELGERAGVSKSAANRFKQNRKPKEA